MAVHHGDDIRTSRLDDFCGTWKVYEVKVGGPKSVASPSGLGKNELGKSLTISKLDKYKVR